MRESLKTLELDACLTVPCLFGNPERDVTVGVHVVDFFVLRRNRRPRTDHRRITK